MRKYLVTRLYCSDLSLTQEAVSLHAQDVCLACICAWSNLGGSYIACTGRMSGMYLCLV